MFLSWFTNGEFLFPLVFFQIQVPVVLASLGSAAAVMSPLFDFHYSSEESIFFIIFIFLFHLYVKSYYIETFKYEILIFKTY